MAGPLSPGSSELSDPPSVESEHESEHLSTAVPSSRPSVDITHTDADHHAAPPPKRRKTGTGGPASLSNYPRDDSTQPIDAQPADSDWDNISLSEDGFSDAPGSPSHDEYSLREEAQTQCLWRDCAYGVADNNDELVKHVQGTHCATSGPKKTKYVCEWGECQRKTSNHPSGYALKAHMRSHTKEKPYYCALPECDKAFTRSDALAKHMRTVHEPELPRGATTADPPTPKTKGPKPKLANGAGKSAIDNSAPAVDEDGNEVTPSPANDNITYIPAHHPITGQPGFMIHYPADIQFTAWESSIPADHLMGLLWHQLHWAQAEGEKLKQEVESLEQHKKEEWTLKEHLLEGVLEAELARADVEGLLEDIDDRVREAMEKDIEPSRQLAWAPTSPPWRHRGRRVAPPPLQYPNTTAYRSHDEVMADVETPVNDDQDRTPSPPPTGKSGGFDGEKDPYDNYVGDTMAHYEHLRKERERIRNSAQSTPVKGHAETDAEADAVGALMGMSGGRS